MNEQAREEQTEVNQDKLWNSNRQLGSSQSLHLPLFPPKQTAPAYWTASAANKKKQFLYPQTENLN